MKLSCLVNRVYLFRFYLFQVLSYQNSKAASGTIYADSNEGNYLISVLGESFG